MVCQGNRIAPCHHVRAEELTWAQLDNPYRYSLKSLNAKAFLNRMPAPWEGMSVLGNDHESGWIPLQWADLHWSLQNSLEKSRQWLRVAQGLAANGHGEHAGYRGKCSVH